MRSDDFGRPLAVACPLCGRRLDHDGQPHDELRPLARPLASGLDPAAVHLHQPLHQRQTDAQPALRLLQRPVHLGEHLEDAGQLVGGDADAGVPDRHHDVAALPLGGQPDAPAPLAVLGGVVQQIHEHLGQPGRVGVHDDRLLR